MFLNFPQANLTTALSHLFMAKPDKNSSHVSQVQKEAQVKVTEHRAALARPGIRQGVAAGNCSMYCQSEQHETEFVI